MKEKRKFDLTTLESSDLNDLAGYLNGHYLDNEPVEFWLNRFDNWWTNNPYHTSDDSMGWILKSDEGIHGFIGCFNSKLSIDGKETLVKNITTWSVNEEAKHYSLKLLNTLILAFPKSLIFCTTGTKDVTKILKAYKFQSYLKEEDINSSVLPISPLNTLLFKAANRTFNIPLFSSIERGLTSFLYSTFFVGSSNPFHFRVMSPNDLTEIENFWQSVKNDLPITTWRNAEYFNWHCFEDKSFSKILIGIYEKDTLIALATMVILDKKIQILECRDFITQSNRFSDASLVNATIKSFLKIARQYSLDLVSVPEDCGLKEVPTSIQQHRGHNNRLFKIRNDFLSKSQLEQGYFTNQGDIYI